MPPPTLVLGEVSAMLTEGAAFELARGFLNQLKPPLMCGSTLGEVPFATERCNHGGGVVVCIRSSYDIATENGTKRKEEPLSRDIRLLAVRDSFFWRKRHP